MDSPGTPPPPPPPTSPASPIPPGVPPPPQPRGWWGRNWKWVVPTGCLSLFLLFCAFVAVIVVTVFSAIKSTNAYKQAVARAKADPRVTAALGTPIKEGLFVSGNTHVNGASGKSDLSIPIHGPNGDATIYVDAIKSAGEWRYRTIMVKIAKTGEKIDLTGPEKKSEQESDDQADSEDDQEQE